MEKKWWLIGSGILIFIIGVSIYLLISKEIPDIPENVIQHSNEPETWIEDGPKDTKIVNVERITKGFGYFTGADMQFKRDDVWTSFAYDGLYKGEYFTGSYEDKIRISQNMDPTDGIMEGIIVEEIVDEVPIVYAFVDQDWRDEMGGSTNILWGFFFDNIKLFNFTEVAPGIYMDTIKDDPERFVGGFNGARRGGVIIGDITPPEVFQGKTEGITAIILQ
jgi:hypothetical protein